MLALGIDCGTSKVAVALVDRGGAPVHAAAQAHHAQLAAPAGRSEQDGERIARTAEELVRALPDNLRAQVAAIGLTGQMHGVLLHDRQLELRSPLISWQDRRAHEDPGFLRSLPHPRPLHAGYGMATLYWWERQGVLAEDLRAATIHGFLAARWCGLERSPIDPTDDQAWGGLAGTSGSIARLLPRQVGHGECIGTVSPTAARVLGIPAGAMVAAPLGDNQASLRATLGDPLHELAFTIGTGCQLAAVVRQDDPVEPGLSDLRPYDGTHQLLVAAPLCGGAAWLWLADTAASWIADLGFPPPGREQLLSALDVLGLAAADRLGFRPHLAGERHDPALTGSISALTLQSGRLGEVARALARGIAANARDLLPAAARAGRLRVVASGNALRRSALLRAMAEDELGLPLVLKAPCEEAATGAALVAAALLAGAGGKPAATTSC
jgi:sugar (pentulose or hexulose) kinase